MSKSNFFLFATMVSLAIFIYMSNFNAKPRKLSQPEVNDILLKHFKNPKHAQIEIKIAKIFSRIANGETNYDHLFHLYDLAESCRDALIPNLDRDEALFTERLIFRDKEHPTSCPFAGGWFHNHIYHESHREDYHAECDLWENGGSEDLSPGDLAEAKKILDEN